MSKLNKKIKKYFDRKNILILLAFFVILVIGLYLRAGGVLTGSFAFTYDVGRDMLEVQKIVSGDIPLIGQTTGLGGLFYGPWWYYILTPVFVLSGGNPQGVAAFMVLVGIGTIVISYYLGNLIQGPRLGLIFAAIISFSQVFVGFSGQIWNPNIAPFFVIVLFVLIQKIFTQKHKLLLFILIGLLCGLVIDSEILFGTLFSIGLLIFFVLQLKTKIFFKPLIGLLSGGAIIISPRVIFELRHNFIMTKTIFSPKQDGEGFLVLTGLLNGIPDRAETIFRQFAETISNNNHYVATLVFLLGIYLIVSQYKSFSDSIKKTTLCVFIILMVFIFGTSIFDRAIWGHYLVGLPILYVLFVGISFNALIIKRKFLGYSLLIVYLFYLLNPIKILQEKNAPLWEGNAAVYRNQVAIIDYIYKDADGNNFNYIAYTPSVHDYPYQYLFAWYGKKYYNYIPAKDTKKILYVILEPDPGYEGRVRDWLKIREGDGSVISEKVVKGGIRVQKRFR